MQNQRSLSHAISLRGAYDFSNVEPAKSSKTVLYVAGGILASLLIAGGIAMVVHNRKERK